MAAIAMKRQCMNNHVRNTGSNLKEKFDCVTHPTVVRLCYTPYCCKIVLHTLLL
jgi:hypothetical protein